MFICTKYSHCVGCNYQYADVITDIDEEFRDCENLQEFIEIKNSDKSIDEFIEENKNKYIGTYDPFAVDVIMHVDRKMLHYLDMDKFPDDAQELIDAIRDAVYLAYVRV